MRNLCGFTCLIVGVLLGGILVAPLSAEAQAPPSSGVPTLKLDGNAIGVASGGTNCTDSAANNPAGWTCYSVTPGTYGQWIVGNYQSNNKARVVVDDKDGTSVPDNMRLTGITIMAPSATSINETVARASNVLCSQIPQCRTGLLRLSKYFAVGNAPNSALKIQKGMDGKFDPPSTESVVNNTMKLVGTACWATVPCDPPDNGAGNIGSPLTVGRFTSPYSFNTDGGIGRSDASPVQVTSSCTTEPTNPDKCNATVQYEYKFEIQGRDTLILSNSLENCNITCTDDPTKVSKKLPACSVMAPLCEDEIAKAKKKGRDDLIAGGGEEAQTCEGACILIRVKGTPPSGAAGATIDFGAIGLDITNPDPITLDATHPDTLGTGQLTFSNLTPDLNPATPDPNDRVFSVESYGAPLTQADMINYSSQLGSVCSVQTAGKNNSTKISITCHVVLPDDMIFVDWHAH